MGKDLNSTPKPERVETMPENQNPDYNMFLADILAGSPAISTEEAEKQIDDFDNLPYADLLNPSSPVNPYRKTTRDQIKGLQ